MADIQSATAEIRRGKERKIEEKNTGQKCNGLPYYIRRAVVIMKYLTKAANYLAALIC